METTETIEFQGITLPETTFASVEVGREYATVQGYKVAVIEVEPTGHAVIRTTKGKELCTKADAGCYGPILVEGPVTDASPEAPEPAEGQPATKRKRDMTIDDLRIEYVQVIGRETGSTDRRYLLWKLSEAAKGNIPVGPIKKHAPRTKGDMQVVPIGMERTVVAKLDTAWKALGFKSRMAFLRDAMVAYLRQEDGQQAKSAADAIEAGGC